MAKKNLELTTAIFPVPVVLVSCQDEMGRESIITISFIGIVNSAPPMIGIGIRPIRYSYNIIKDSNEFVVNIPSEDMLKIADFCGTVTGKKVNKYSTAKLTPLPSEKVKVPSIAECPINLECVLRKVISFDSHDLFIGEIINIRVDEDVLKDNKNSVDIHKVMPFALCLNGKGDMEYWALRERLNKYGFTKGKIE